MKKIKKNANWESQLLKWLDDNRHPVPFSRDRFDCVRRTADLVQSYTNYDLAKPFRRLYSSDLTAHRLLVKNGGTMLRLITSHFEQCGLVEIPVRQATLGDLAYWRAGAFGTIGVCVGSDGVMQGKEGLGTLPILQAKKAWRISS